MTENSYEGISPAEAQATLREIENLSVHVRKSIACGPFSTILILWGAIWMTGFAAEAFLPHQAGAIFTALDIAGIVATFAIPRYARRPMQSGRGDARIALFWLALFLYAVLWLWLLGDHDFARTGAYLSTVSMFGYVILGLWLSRFLLWLGLGVTALTIAGLHWLPGHFAVWMALTGGGSLMVAGFYIRRFWR